MTDRTCAERVLADSEARPLVFFDRALAGIAVFDRHMRYLAASRRYLADVEPPVADPNAIIGHSHYELFPEIPEHWRDIHRRVLLHGETVCEKEPSHRADGRTDWVHWEMTPWREPDGTIGGAVLVCEVLSAREQTELALRTSEARLRLAIDSAEFGTWDTDLTTGRVVRNARANRILGLSPPPLPNRSDWLALIHPDDRHGVETALLAAEHGERPVHREYRIIRPGGDIRRLRAHGRFLRNAEGEPVRSTGVFKDITDRKQAEQELLASRARLEAALAAMSDGVFILDAQGDIIHLNEAFAAFHRFTSKAECCRTLAAYPALFEVSLEDDQPVAPEQWAVPRALRGETAAGVVYRLRRKDTGERWTGSVNFAPIRDQAGEITGAVVTARDITAAKQAEAALAESQARLRAILDNVPDAMVVVDEHGIIRSFSATAERLFGWLAEEVIGRNVSMLMASPDRERHDNYIARYVRTGEPHLIGRSRVVTGMRRDGSTFPHEIWLGEMRSDGQRLFTAFMRDVSERQATERRLQALQAELLHVSRLGIAGTMATTLAHELNQPLTAVTSAVRAARRILDQRAADHPDLPLLREALDLAADQALRAGQIIYRLREFVTHGGAADHRPADLQMLIAEAASLTLIGAGDAGVATQFRIAANLPSVLVDRVQIQQVLVNLIRNAMQAMAEPLPDGTPRTDAVLTVTAALAERGTVSVAVADTGPGLSPDVAGRLFEPFVTTKADGMGLGLSICRSIVEAHDGHLTTEPNPDGGTIFRFTLPTSLDPGRSEAASKKGRL